MSDVLAPPKPRTVLRDLPKIRFYSDGGILLKEVRASYPHLDKPWGMAEGADKKYGIMGLIPKTQEYRESVQAFNAFIDQFLVDLGKEPLPQSRKCLRNGDETGKPEMMNHWTVSASEHEQPRLRGRYMEIIPPEKVAQVIYWGCWVSMLIKLWYQEHKTGGRRVNANLHAVQFIRDDKPFGRGRITDAIVDDTFEPIADDDGGFQQQQYDL